MDCFFCAVVNGSVETFKVFDSDHFVGILDINPASNGHILLIPKRHVKSFEELNDVELTELFDAIDFITEKIREVLNAKGFQIFAANGPEAGQRAEHFFVHIIPTYEKLAIEYSFNKYNKEEINKTATKLKQAFKENYKEK